MTNSEHSLFVQDDWQISIALTANLGLRYEVYVADTEEQNRLVNFDPVGLTADLRGRRRRQPQREQEDAPQPGPAARRGLGHERATRRTCCARATAISYYPLAQSASNLLGQQVPYTISQNYAAETNPRDFSRGAAALQPVPADRSGQAHDHGRELNAANPRVLGPRLRERDALHADLAGQLRAAAHADPDGGDRLRGQQGQPPGGCFNPNEVQPGSGLAGLAPAHPAALEHVEHRPVRPHQQVRATTACRPSC